MEEALAEGAVQEVEPHSRLFNVELHEDEHNAKKHPVDTDHETSECVSVDESDSHNCKDQQKSCHDELDDLLDKEYRVDFGILQFLKRLLAF